MTKWIDPEVAIPANGSEVIVTIAKEHGKDWKYITSSAWHWNGGWFDHFDGEIIADPDGDPCTFIAAWRPLPKPYSGFAE